MDEDLFLTTPNPLYARSTDDVMFVLRELGCFNIKKTDTLKALAQWCRGQVPKSTEEGNREARAIVCRALLRKL